MMSPPSPVEESEPEEEEEVEEEVEEVEVSEDEEEIVYEEVSEEEEEEEQEQQQNPKQKPSVAESISHLQSLHGALSDFLSHYNALQQTLDSVNSSIDARSNGTERSVKAEATKTDERQGSELESICRTNGAKSLRRYISAHLSEIDRLRKEVPEALKLASDPAKLALEAMGGFYLQSNKAFQRADSKTIDARRAGILLMEFYLLAGCPVAQQLSSTGSVTKSAKDAAVSWRSRLIKEGGIETASPVDALGLVLLIASFGVPAIFKPKDLHGLLQLSNLKKKGDVLRRSTVLVQRMPGIINDLLAKEMHVEAVDLICAFGLEEKFLPLSLLASFVNKSCEVGVGERREGQCSLKSLKESYEKELAALKSVVKCVEDHKFNASELASLRIYEKIARCEKEISKAEQKLQDNNLKRFGDVEPLKNQENQPKRLRPSSKASDGPIVQTVGPAQEQGTAAIFDSRYAYNGHMANNMPHSSEGSRGLAERERIMLLERSVHGPAGGWHGNEFYQNSGGQSLHGTPHSLEHESTWYSAAAGPNVYYPASGYKRPASGQHVYQPLASGQHVYQPPASVQNFYQHPASEQNLYQSYGSSLASGGRNLYRFADSVSEQELPNHSTTSDVEPPATNTVMNPSHQSSYAS